MLFGLFPSKNDQVLRKLQPLVRRINGLEAEVQKLDDGGLQAAFEALIKRHEEGEGLDKLLPESFALTREAAKRTLGLRPYDVQLMGGMILHQGKIAEMKTGEGKTLMATLAAALNAIPGDGVHMVTVNDYLAQRDAEWMRPVFEALGLSCAAVVHGMDGKQRQAAYGADITYATNNELGFDYLRDNMAYDPFLLVQRPPAYAIVDEVDSILIDEARTPLIISGPLEDNSQQYITINGLMPQFEAETDFELDEKMKAVTLTDVGMDKAETLLQQQNLMQDGESLYDVQHVSLVHHINNALRAHYMFRKDVQYIVKDDKIILIDEFTGRMTPGRRLSEGLHQAIEAKEGVSLQQENQTLASITYQNYFRLYPKLAGMTGTAETEAEEFGSIYNLDVVVVPTNVPVAREDVADILYLEYPAKVKAILADIEDCSTRGQPVLVGTTSIEKSEELSAALKKAKVKHNVLNARYHEQEAEIIAQAGRKSAVTIATNMAGRGTDIKLGGNLELLLGAAKDGTHAAEITAAYEKEKAEVLEAGGLRVIGTERHESRRIDNQLRGRSGRQGDPGSSVFYLSTDDDLLRIFAVGLMGQLLDRMKAGDSADKDEPVQSKIFSKSIETAQRKIESMHFDARKHLLKFDNILNEQRKVIYGQRREILTDPLSDGNVVLEMVHEFRHDVVEDLFAAHLNAKQDEDGWDVEALRKELIILYGVEFPFADWVSKDQKGAEEMQEIISKALDEIWHTKVQQTGPEIMLRLAHHLLLQVIDRQWQQHLRQLDHLRQGINLRGYAQKDPVNEYSKEAFVLFEGMLGTIRREVVSLMSRLQIQPQAVPNVPAPVEQEAEDVAEAPKENRKTRRAKKKKA